MPPFRKHNDESMAGTRSKANRKHGRPSLCESQKAKWCDCGGKSGNEVRKMDVSRDNCGGCLRGCSSNNDCTEMRNEESSNREKVHTRLLTGVTDHEEGSPGADRLSNAAPPLRIAEKQLPRHKSLNSPSATETDLATALGQKKFFPSAL